MQPPKPLTVGEIVYYINAGLPQRVFRCTVLSVNEPYYNAVKLELPDSTWYIREQDLGVTLFRKESRAWSAVWDVLSDSIPKLYETQDKIMKKLHQDTDEAWANYQAACVKEGIDV